MNAYIKRALSLIIFGAMLLSILSGCAEKQPVYSGEDMSPPAETTAIYETDATTEEATAAPENTMVYETYGDRTTVTESFATLPITPSDGVDWDENVYEIQTIEYFDVGPSFDADPYPDTFIAHNIIDDVKFNLVKTPKDLSDPTTPPYYYAVTDVLFNGVSYHLDEPLQYVLYRIWIEVGEDVMVIGNQSYTKDEALDIPAVWFILTPDGVLRIDNNVFEDGYELKFWNIDRVVTYSYTNAAYIIAVQDIFSTCRAFTTNEQFFRKSGNIIAVDGAVVFEQTLYQTINDFYKSNGFGMRASVPDSAENMSDYVDYVNNGWFNN